MCRKTSFPIKANDDILRNARGVTSRAGKFSKMRHRKRGMRKHAFPSYPFPFFPYSTTQVSPLLRSFSKLPGPDFVMAASIWSTSISS